eukprot:6294325-Heterocapsa_arctica.AAC.1
MRPKINGGILVNETGERIWHQHCPEYKGRVGQAVIDLGITLRDHNQKSINKQKRVDDTVCVVKKIQSLGLSVRDKVNIIKTAAQSKATYGAAVDPFTVAQINTLRAKYTQALWPKKYTACRTTGLLIVDQGELEPGINIIKKILVNWLRQIEGGIHNHTAEYWEDFNIQTGG